MGLFAILTKTRPHLTSNKYATFEIKRIPHPRYSPDPAPCDFWLFGYFQHCLEGGFFDDDSTLEGVVSEVLMSIGPDMFVSVFAEWKRRL
jgi:hypothetical protein